MKSTVLPLVAALLPALLAPGAARADSLGVRLVPHGYVAFDFGQIVRATDVDGYALRLGWQEKLLAQATMDAALGERARVVLSAECRLGFSYPQIQMSWETQEPNFSFYLHRAEGTYRILGPAERPWLELGLGYFPFKYNPSSRNLGEYLFRSGAYPPYLTTDFEFPMARLLGLRLSGTIGSWLRQDLLFSSEASIFPTQDFTLSYIATPRIRDIVELGAGVSFSHVLPVQDSLTSPVNKKNHYVTESGDTGYYTFRNVKLMARLSFDPKPLLGRPAFFGPNDLQLYAEAAVLGVKNYPVYYDTLKQRVPVMLGFNVPNHPLVSYGTLTLTQVLGLAGLLGDPDKVPAFPAAAVAFGLIGAGAFALEKFTNVNARPDVLSFEVEYFGSRLANDYKVVFEDNYPKPAETAGTHNTGDDWKWSVYARKDLGRFFTLSALAANDHLRPYTAARRFQDKQQTLRNKDHWYYMVRAMFRF